MVFARINLHALKSNKKALNIKFISEYCLNKASVKESDTNICIVYTANRKLDGFTLTGDITSYREYLSPKNIILLPGKLKMTVSLVLNWMNLPILTFGLFLF